jgi:hypothetical protein
MIEPTRISTPFFESDIEDLIKISEHEDANMELLLKAAYGRGVTSGEKSAKEKAIDILKNIERYKII